MKGTPMPIVAGILDLISGIISLLSFIGLLIGTIVTGGLTQGWFPGFPWTPGINIAVAILVPLTIVSFIVGILSLIGGIYALQRKNWSLALAGSIFALFPTFLLGLVAIILTALSKNEFE